MKATKIIIALSCLAMLSACGGNNPESSSASNSESSTAKKTMDFLKDGQFYVSVPNDVIAPVGVTTPKIKINGTAFVGTRTVDLGGKFELTAEGEFTKDIYVTVAKSVEEGQISVKTYGPIDKEGINEAFATIAARTGVPNKLFICFSTEKGVWDKGLDEDMDEEITFAWGIHE